MAHTLGVLLAGGRGVRLGAGTPKALATLAGVTLIERAALTLESACDELVVTGPEGLRDSLSLALGGRRRYAADPEEESGPLGGAVAGLGAADYSAAVVLGVDFPLARPAALRSMMAWLLERIARTPETTALVPVPAGIPQPLVAAYAPSAREGLAARFHAGERSIVSAVRALAPEWIEDEQITRLDGGAENFLNVNHPADLREAERHLRERVP
jgi:molybdopterin-guanine dinucleotide biosynthesis protein A